MKYEEIVAKVKKAYEKLVNTGEHLAAQVNITGEGEGAFYIEGKDQNINVEPYEYYDRDLIITGSADEILNIVKGKSTLGQAVEQGRVFVSGNIGRIAEFDVMAAKPVKSSTRKSTKISESATKAGEAVKEGAKKATKAASKAGEAVKEGAKKVAKKTSETAAKAGEAVIEATGKTTEKAAKAVAKTAGKIAQKASETAGKAAAKTEAAAKKTASKKEDK